MGAERPKQFALLAGEPILARTINRFAQAIPGAEIVVVLPAEHADFWRNLSARFELAAHRIALGGPTRFHSVQQGLAALKTDPELIAIHDGVRPLLSLELIHSLLASATEHGAALPVIEPVDSFRETDDEGSHAVDRRRLRIVQTPQVFRAEILHEAYQTPYNERFTDDASVVEQAGYPLHLVPGERMNLKITTPDDLIVAEALLAAREEQENDEKHL